MLLLAQQDDIPDYFFANLELEIFNYEMFYFSGTIFNDLKLHSRLNSFIDPFQ